MFIIHLSGLLTMQCYEVFIVFFVMLSFAYEYDVYFYETYFHHEIESFFFSIHPFDHILIKNFSPLGCIEILFLKFYNIVFVVLMTV